MKVSQAYLLVALMLLAIIALIILRTPQQTVVISSLGSIVSESCGPGQADCGNVSISSTNNHGVSQSAYIEILGLDWTTEGPLPQVLYKVSGLPKVNIAIGLVSKQTGQTIWGVEDVQSSVHGGVGAINLNSLDKHGQQVSVPAGDYFLRLQEFHTGVLVAESASFHVGN